MHLMYFSPTPLARGSAGLEEGEWCRNPQRERASSEVQSGRQISKERITTKKRFGLLPTQVEGKLY